MVLVENASLGNGDRFRRNFYYCCDAMCVYTHIYCTSLSGNSWFVSHLLVFFYVSQCRVLHGVQRRALVRSHESRNSEYDNCAFSLILRYFQNYKLRISRARTYRGTVTNMIQRTLRTLQHLRVKLFFTLDIPQNARESSTLPAKVIKILANKTKTKCIKALRNLRVVSRSSHESSCSRTLVINLLRNDCRDRVEENLFVRMCFDSVLRADGEYIVRIHRYYSKKEEGKCRKEMERNENLRFR